MKINMPCFVKNALNILHNNGFEAYVVGGCVRDSIMGISPHDWDIASNASPNETISAFKGFKVIETGIKHGTVTVMICNNPLEITTYRIDGKYSDNRRPDTVEFTSSLKEDLSRRDFTINAMAYNETDGLIDYFNGIWDLKNSCIRCVGDAGKRFNEDALRIIRALRFASVFSFKIEIETSKSIMENRRLLKNIAPERISAEFNRLLMGHGVKSILLDYSNVFVVFIPEIKPSIGFKQNNPYHIYDVWIHTLETIENIKSDKILRLAMFFHDLGKPFCYTQDKFGRGHFNGHGKYSTEIAYNVLKRLKYDNLTIEAVCVLIQYHDAKIIPDRKIIKRLLGKIDSQYFELIMEVHEADAKAKNPKFLKSNLYNLECVKKVYNQIINENQCFLIKDLKINGRDIIDIGIVQGVQIGKILSKLVEMVIEEQIQNDRQQLLSAAQNITKYIN